VLPFQTYLKNFEVDVETSIKLFFKIPKDKIVIAESGIKNVETVKYFRSAGFKGFLIGENFMKEDNPGLAFEKFVNELNSTGI
jgi:indole-3-glycerol phosphate synthase